jgi:hypothetical protein
MVGQLRTGKRRNRKFSTLSPISKQMPTTRRLDALEKALGYRLYAAVNRQDAECVDGNTLLFDARAPQTAGKAT